MTNKEALKHLAAYCFYLMEQGVTQKDFSDRMSLDINAIIKDERMMLEVVVENTLR